MSEKTAWALCLHAKDNVATVLKDAQAGEPFVVRDKSGQTLGAFEVVEAIPRGHKIAVVDIPVQADVIKYAEPAGKAGLSFMDCPGQDLVSICGIVAGGAHLVLFTTGRGTPLGFAIAPVLKISANSEAVRKMAENIDMDLSDVLTGDMSLDDAGRIIAAKVLEVAEGKLTKAEKLGHREFGFHSIGPTL